MRTLTHNFGGYISSFPAKAGKSGKSLFFHLIHLSSKSMQDEKVMCEHSSTVRFERLPAHPTATRRLNGPAFWLFWRGPSNTLAHTRVGKCNRKNQTLCFPRPFQELLRLALRQIVRQFPRRKTLSICNHLVLHLVGSLSVQF
jgi:hypothetical protein